MLKLIYTQFIYDSVAFCHAKLARAWCFTQRLISITVSKLPGLAEHNCSAAIVARAHISSAEQLPDLSESTLNQGKEAKIPSGNTKTVPVCRSVFGSGGRHRGGGDHQIQEEQ